MMLKVLVLTLALVGHGLAYDFSVGSFLERWGLDEHATPFEKLPTPEDVVYVLDEEPYEDYLDFWLNRKYERESPSTSDARATCTVGVNTLSEPQPVFVLGNALKNPTGITGNLEFASAETITAGCAGTGNRLVHASATQNPAQSTVVCQSGTSFSGPWLSGQANFNEIKCANHAPWVETRTASSCANGQGVKINVAVQTTTASYVILTCCFKETTSEAVFVEYDQKVENKIHQANVARPNFLQGSWYPGLSVDNLYTQASQKNAIASVVGSAMADKYVNSTYFLARGHLAAKTDFILSPSQRATFTFINVAPQWQPFNGGNWNTLEQKLRERIGDTGKNTRVYTGTFDILQLKDSGGAGKRIYLSPSNNKIPVPLWFYKVVHEPSTNRATAYVGLNNPHVTLAEAKNMAFCTDVCRGNSQFSWLNWKPDDMGLGYGLCCDVNDFRNTVKDLPAFTVSGILT